MWETLFVAAPEGATWPLDLDIVEDRLRQRFPDITTSRHTSAVSGDEYLDFALQLNGMVRTGVYVARGNLVLNDGTPAEWADTIAWFLTLLPEATPVVVMTENNTQLTPMPSTASPEQIRVVFDKLIAAA
jgi:hypothetical protein